MRGGDAGGKQWMPGVSPALGHKDKAGFEKEFMRVGLPCASDRYKGNVRRSFLRGACRVTLRLGSV